MYGETFYGRHTAQHQLQWSQIKIRNENCLTKTDLIDLTSIPLSKKLAYVNSEFIC